MKIKIKGMHCQSCIKLIEMELKENNIKAKVSMNLVEYKDNFQTEKIKQIIKNMGYDVE